MSELSPYPDLFAHAAECEKVQEEAHADRLIGAIAKSHAYSGVRVDAEGNLIIPTRGRKVALDLSSFARIAAYIEDKPAVTQRTFIEGGLPGDKHALHGFDDVFITPEYFSNMARFVYSQQQTGGKVLNVFVGTPLLGASDSGSVRCDDLSFRNEQGGETHLQTYIHGLPSWRADRSRVGILAIAKPYVEILEGGRDPVVRLNIPLSKDAVVADWNPRFDRSRVFSPEIKEALELTR